MSSQNCHLRFSIVVLETLKFKWQCSQYLELNPTCAYLSPSPQTLLHYVNIRNGKDMNEPPPSMVQ